MSEIDFTGMSRKELEDLLRHKIDEGVTLGLRWGFRCIDGVTGEEKWYDENHNRVVDVGLNRILDIVFGSTAAETLYIGLTDGTPTTAAGDTMSSHAGWAEVTSYDEAARQTASFGSAASQSIDNSGSVAQFTLNATVTVGGGFLTNDNTKGGTTGILYSVEAFTGGDRSGVSGDIVQVTITVTASDA